MTFEDFLKDCLDHGHTQVRLVSQISEPAGVTFYAHGQGGSSSGETFEGLADGDSIIKAKTAAEMAEPASEPVEGTNDPVADEPEDTVVAFAAAPSEGVTVVPTAEPVAE